MRSLSCLFLALSTTLAVSAPVFAQEGAPPSVKVSLAGLDLDSRQGAAAALQRIDIAAASVCGDRPNILDLRPLAQFERCHSAAVDGAVRTLNRPLLNIAAGSYAPPVMVAAR